MKTVILHIGLPKTGTTYIQQSLERNRDRLLERNFAYYLDPEYLGEGSAMPPNHSVGLCLCGEVDEGFRDAVWHRFVQFVEETPAGNVVVSSEPLANGEVDVPFVKRQLSHVRVRVIAYLRDEVALLASTYAEMVKNGVLSCTLDELYEGAPGLVDYRDRLKSWFHTFGEETVELGNYAVASKADGGLFTHFIEKVGLSGSKSITWDMPAGKPNKRWPQPVIELLRQWNSLDMPAEDRGILREEMRLLLLKVPEVRALQEVSVSTELADRIRRDTEPLNRELWRRCT